MWSSAGGSCCCAACSLPARRRVPGQRETSDLAGKKFLRMTVFQLKDVSLIDSQILCLYASLQGSLSQAKEQFTEILVSGKEVLV